MIQSLSILGVMVLLITCWSRRHSRSRGIFGRRPSDYSIVIPINFVEMFSAIKTNVEMFSISDFVKAPARQMTTAANLLHTAQTQRGRRSRRRRRRRRRMRKAEEEGRGVNKNDKRNNKETSKTHRSRSNSPSKGRAQEEKMLGSLSGIATLRREGDVVVKEEENHKVITSEFNVGPLQLEVSKMVKSFVIK